PDDGTSDATTTETDHDEQQQQKRGSKRSSGRGKRHPSLRDREKEKGARRRSGRAADEDFPPSLDSSDETITPAKIDALQEAIKQMSTPVSPTDVQPPQPHFGDVPDHR